MRKEDIMKDEFTKKELQALYKHCKRHNDLDRIVDWFRNTTYTDIDNHRLERLLREWANSK